MEKGSHCHSFKQKQYLYQVLNKPTKKQPLADSSPYLWAIGMDSRDPQTLLSSRTHCHGFGLRVRKPRLLLTRLPLAAGGTSPGKAQHLLITLGGSKTAAHHAAAPACSYLVQPEAPADPDMREASEVADAPLGGWPGCGENAMAIAGRVGLWTQFQLMPGWLMVAD